MSAAPWIVLPTYNEAANIEPVIAAARAALPEARILVVDDNSPDG
ncbi:MAG: dolichol-phosphate mannosyltransferase, partial [Solirubrobacteraceae bacterium]|nr:dolichol-phosphate mannosyltransferase [Solirubrobacteraceae bacterium]